jgi:hypothetical protein
MIPEVKSFDPIVGILEMNPKNGNSEEMNQKILKLSNTDNFLVNNAMSWGDSAFGSLGVSDFDNHRIREHE